MRPTSTAFLVRDLDKTLALLKDERYWVITAGGSPLELPSWPGLTGKIRAVFVRDPDGTPVELVELSFHAGRVPRRAGF